MGEETAYDIADVVNQKSKIKKNAWEQNEILKMLKSQNLDDWAEIPDIGPIVAKSIYDYLQDKNNIGFIERLFDAGVEIQFEKVSGGKLVDKTFVLTGGLQTMTRDEAKVRIRLLGGDISESVSQKTDYVIAGTDPGEKYSRAKELNVKIISEREFLELIGG